MKRGKNRMNSGPSAENRTASKDCPGTAQAGDRLPERSRTDMQESVSAVGDGRCLKDCGGALCRSTGTDHAGGDMVQYRMVDLPRIAIIGKEGFCTREKNTVQELWQEARSHFGEIADLGMKNADGSFVGFWGAMSDETLSFLPWTDDFTKGLYLAGLEVYEDTPVPDGWAKWVMPARRYIVTDAAPERYAETFRYVIDSLIPQLGMKLAGAVCDFTEPATGQNKLFFPVA